MPARIVAVELGKAGCQTGSMSKVPSRMSEKETLQAFLSPQHLRELAGPKVYARGEEYSAGNNVQLHEHTRVEAIGEVMGSQVYRVELR